MSTMLPFRVEGSGHPLLLIHGWGVTYTVWQKLVPLLAPHFQLILVELPGVCAAVSAAGVTRCFPLSHLPAQLLENGSAGRAMDRCEAFGTGELVSIGLAALRAAAGTRLQSAPA